MYKAIKTFYLATGFGFAALGLAHGATNDAPQTPAPVRSQAKINEENKVGFALLAVVAGGALLGAWHKRHLDRIKEEEREQKEQARQQRIRDLTGGGDPPAPQ